MRRAVLTVAALALAACTRAEIVELDAGAPRDGGGMDGAAPLDGGEPDAGVDGGCAYAPVDTEGQPAGCVVRRPPGRPLCDTGATTPDYVFALQTLDLHVGVEVGLDLDGWCTDDVTGPASCVPNANHSVDRSEGIDNAFAELIGTLEFGYRATYGTELAADIDLSLSRGAGNPTIRLRGWNGLADDQNMEVAIVPAACGGPAGTTTCDESSDLPLDWSRADNVFLPDASGLVAGDPEMPRLLDGTAYMSGNVMVARLPAGADIAIPTPHGPIVMQLNEAWLVAQLAADRSGLATGFVAGKWPRPSAEACAQYFGLCPGTPQHMPIATTVAGALDVVANGDGGPGVPCDAVSIAIGFTAQLATWGPPATATAPPDPCP